MIAVRVVLLAWLVLLGTPAAGQTSEATTGAIVRSRLIDVPVLRCRFEQTKHLQGFRNPLVSVGSVLFSRDHGFVWSTIEPFASTLVLTRTRVVSRSADGNAHTVVGQAASPAVVTGNELMMALIGGDIDTLAKRFEIAESLAEDGSWHLRLVPKSGPLSQLFERIDLQGDRYMRRVSLEEVGGDRTEIRFLDPYDTASPLTDAEVNQFE